MSLHKTHICVVKSLVKIAAVSWHSLRRFIKPAPGRIHNQDDNSIGIGALSRKFQNLVNPSHNKTSSK